MINHLVPEARVFEHHIFRGDAALHPQDLDTEDEDKPIEEQEGQKSEGEGMRSAAGEKTEIPTPDKVDKREKCGGSGIDISEANNARPVAVEAMEVSVAENEGTIGDSVSVTSVTTHQFSPAWIEKEALALLGTIQQNTPKEKTANQSKVLLAGYGFGGIVVKQVQVTFFQRGGGSCFLTLSLSLSQGCHHRQHDSQVLRRRPEHL